MSVYNYRDLIVWQKAMKLAKEIYIVSAKLPKEEIYGLANQMKRAAISIPSNIAEGQCRNSTKEFLYFLSIARGSKSELETQLLLCEELGFLSPDDTEKSLLLLDEVGKMIYSIINKLSRQTGVEQIISLLTAHCSPIS